MMTTYQNFDLLVTRSGGGYNARVISSPAGQANVDFVLPFSPAELRSFFWLAGRLSRQLRLVTVEPPTVILDPKAFGARLYAAVFAGEVGKVFARSLDLSKDKLRIRLRLGDVLELADLPWEYLYATDLDRHLALSAQTPLVRYVELALGEETLAVAPPLHILAVVADPSDVVQLDVEKEWHQLQAALADLSERRLVVLERLEKATLPMLQARLRGSPLHILHFIGHGTFDADHNTGTLIFADNAGKSHPVSAERLATLLHDHQSLRLVLLNACQGAQGGQSDPFAGVAQKLVQQGMPAVVAMQFPVSDQAAIALAYEFYRAVADGYAVDAAVTEARKALYAAGDEREWGTPVLFSRSADNQILTPTVDTVVAESKATAKLSSTGNGLGIAFQIDRSTLSNSPINIQAGPTQNSLSEPIRVTDVTRSDRFALQLTNDEGIVRRLYRSLLALENQQLFSDDKQEKAMLQTQIAQHVQQLETLLPAYVAQARQLIWQIPVDIQAAIKRANVSV